MSIYYITDVRGNIYELDATSNISYTESGKITSHTVESGESVSDHYVNMPIDFHVEGTISDIKSFSALQSEDRVKSTREFIDGLRQIKTNKEQFSFHYGEKVGIFQNCMFQNIQIQQTPQRGNSGEIDSFSISADIKQIRIARRAIISPFRDPSVRDGYQDQVNGAGTTESPSIREFSALERAAFEAKHGVSPEEFLSEGG